MSNESSAKKLPRPNLHVPPSKWSGAQSGGMATRVAIIGTVAAVIGGISLVFLYPFVNIDRYRDIQKYNRAGIKQEDVQPAGLPVWRDPFDRKNAG